VHTNIGTALQLEGRIDDAIAHYCKALAIDPKNKRAESNLEDAVERQVDKEIDSGGKIVLDVVEIGPGGSLKVAPKDPCAKFRDQK